MAAEERPGVPRAVVNNINLLSELQQAVFNEDEPHCPSQEECRRLEVLMVPTALAMPDGDAYSELWVYRLLNARPHPGGMSEVDFFHRFNAICCLPYDPTSNRDVSWTFGQGDIHPTQYTFFSWSLLMTIGFAMKNAAEAFRNRLHVAGRQYHRRTFIARVRFRTLRGVVIDTTNGAAGNPEMVGEDPGRALRRLRERGAATEAFEALHLNPISMGNRPNFFIGYGQQQVALNGVAYAGGEDCQVYQLLDEQLDQLREILGERPNVAQLCRAYFNGEIQHVVGAIERGFQALDREADNAEADPV